MFVKTRNNFQGFIVNFLYYIRYFLKLTPLTYGGHRFSVPQSKIFAPDGIINI